MTITFHSRTDGIPTGSSLRPMTFPAGEHHIHGTLRDDETPAYVIIRGADVDDLIVARLWVETAKHQRPDAHIAAIIPYLPAARADRGTPFGAGVYADLINGIGADQVICVDPHSPVMPGLIDHLTVIHPAPLVRDHIIGAPGHDDARRYTGIIAPDAGAHDRARRVADACGLPVYQAQKHRDFETGKLTGFSCEPLPAGGRYLIVDDICDGGGTFRGLAEFLGLPTDRISLYVTHGVFSGNAAQLADHFGEIWTTDSFPTRNTDPHLAAKVRTIPLDRTLIAAVDTPSPTLTHA